MWISVLVIGTLFAALGTRSLASILFAQVANGFLLPVVAVFLLVLMNRRSLLGEHTNRMPSNLLGAIVVAISIFLGGFKIAQVGGII